MRDIRRAVLPLAFHIRLGVNLDQLRKVTAIRQCGRNCGFVRLKSVRAELEPRGRRSCSAQALDEDIGGRLVATPEGEVQNQLAVPLKSNETVGVTDAVIVRFVRRFVRFLFPHLTPDFIALNVANRNIHDETDPSAFHTGRQPAPASS